MKTHLDYFTTLLFVFVSFVYCVGQDVILATQSEVDAFDPNTSVINGYLHIEGSNSIDPILNLDNLSNLTYISGDLYMHNCISLSNVDGLHNLTNIGGFLNLVDNSQLENIDGLSNLVSIGGYLRIHNNNGLINIDGLSNLVSVGEYLWIRYNNSLENINGLFDLTSIGGNMVIADNISLTDCCGIKRILNTPESIFGNISIFGNPSGCSNENQIIEICKMTVSLVRNFPCSDTNNGSIQVQVSNFNTGPFNYAWNNTTTGETGTGVSESEFFIIEDLAAGTYGITVTEPNLDEVIETGIVLSEILGSSFDIIEIITTNSSNGMNNGSIGVAILGGTTPYSYGWSGESSGSLDNVSDDTLHILGLTQGIYHITVSDDNENEQVISVNLLDETVPVAVCNQPLDIVILNDVSGSVDEVEYAESKLFFVDFLNEANIGLGTDDSRAAIIEWASSDMQSIRIPITGVISDLQNYLNMDRAFDGGTNPGDAMNFGKNYLDGVARPEATKVLVLSTDGSPGQIPPSLIALADEFKAEGYYILTIALDNAYSDSGTRDILQQVSSTDLLAPGAPAYSDLDQDLAQNIVDLYLCPIDPGSTASTYLDRDGEIQIIDIQPVGLCPTPDNVEITFTVEAKEELSVPTETPISFYYNNPELFGSSPIMTWLIPCAIPAGTIETFTATLPVSTAANIYAVLNDDGSQSPAITFPITETEELVYSNNIDNISICTEPIATLQAFKYTTTPLPICNSNVIYTVDVCNISSVDATGVTITDIAPTVFFLMNTNINDNGCVTDNGGNFDIPAGCCISITYIYNASIAPDGFYNNQDVNLGGPAGQIYIHFEGVNTTVEDVLIDGTVDCPSTVVNFSKEVNTMDICEDAFVTYTFTIDNQLNIPLQGLEFMDILPAPVNWIFEPYNLQGLSISTFNVSGNIASFTIDEVYADTIATFSLDAYLGDWDMDGVLTNTATLENVLDLVNGGFQTLVSNTTMTNVSVLPEITILDTIYVENTEAMVTLDASLIGAATVTWTTIGDGSFSTTDTPTTTYSFGTDDYVNGEVSLFVSSMSDCGEDGQNVLVILIPPCGIIIDDVMIGNCNDNGTNSDGMDDIYQVTLNASVINNDTSNTYLVTDGTNDYGPFIYGQEGSIMLPADGNTYTLTLTDTDDIACLSQVDVSQNSCSNACLLSIDNISIGNCYDNGTDTDPSDDTYEVSINASALNPSVNETYSVTDGTNSYGPFFYGMDEIITLPADGNTYDLTFIDSDDSSCTMETQVSQNSCSDACAITMIDVNIGVCNPNGTVSDASDDTYEISLDASALNTGNSNQFVVSEGGDILGTFTYNVGGIITLPADGNLYTIVFADADEPSCITQTQVSQSSCSNTCALLISDMITNACNDNGTDDDPADDIFDLEFEIDAFNPGISGTYQISDGMNQYGPFTYGILEAITLPATGNAQSLIITDMDDANCLIETQVEQNPCSCLSNVFYHLEQPLCKEDLTGAIIIDSLKGGGGPFNYSLDNENFYPLDSMGIYLDSIANLYIGTYDFYIMDEADSGCLYQFSFTIEEPFPFEVNIGEDTIINLGNSVPISMTSNIPFGQLDWTWNDTTYLDCTDCINPIATPLESTSYILEVLNPDGCVALDTINIKVIEDYHIYIPNAFTPNGDGANDLFQIYPDLSIAEIRSIKVFSRWGGLVYSQGAYDPHDSSSFNIGWDGEGMNQNVFVYMIELRLVNGESILLSGDITLIR